VEYLEWSQAREQKENQKLKKENQELLDLNRKDTTRLSKKCEVRENWNQPVPHVRAGPTTWTCCICVTASSWTPRSQ
jgi:hypothetical protein